MRLTASKALEFLVLQDPEQLRLQRQGNVSNFVEKQSPSVRHVETANFLGERSGESALFVSKKFAFEQVKRDGSTIQLHERAPAPWADIVNGAGDQLLTCTRLSEDQHRGIGRCDSFHLREHKVEGRAVTYDLVESVLGLTLFR
jgi:hypothetical protein